VGKEVVYAESGPDTIFIQLKTGLKKDDAQICVAYNMVWTALHEGKKINVIIDADAVKHISDQIGRKGFKSKIRFTGAFARVVSLST
jgi:hypothetical protein